MILRKSNLSFHEINFPFIFSSLRLLVSNIPDNYCACLKYFSCPDIAFVLLARSQHVGRFLCVYFCTIPLIGVNYNLCFSLC
jgi:hypothetical protein